MIFWTKQLCSATSNRGGGLPIFHEKHTSTSSDKPQMGLRLASDEPQMNYSKPQNLSLKRPSDGLQMSIRWAPDEPQMSSDEIGKCQ